MSQFERVATLCREQLASRGLAHTFNSSIIKSYLQKNGNQGNAFSIALKTADTMIENYKPTEEEQTAIYEQFNP